MILSISNPCNMDCNAWLTVSSLIMISLVFILTVIAQISNENEKKFEKGFASGDVKRWKRIGTMCNHLSYLSFILFVLTIIAIFLFIFHLEQEGAVVICSVLVSVVFLFVYWLYLLKPVLKSEIIMTNSSSNIESIKTAIKKDIHYEPTTTNQPDSPESN